MRRKNVLGWVTVIVGVFVFAMTAYSQTGTVAEIACEECSKCTLGNVPCATTNVVEGPQGTTTTVTEPLSPFDYDGRPFEANGFGTTGYCTGFNFAQDPERDCKLLFDVCNCPEVCKVAPGTLMGIQMIIETPGVYFADDTMNTIYFDIRERRENFCRRNNDDGLPLDTEMQEAVVFYNAADYRVAYQRDTVNGGREDYEIRNFGDIVYYRNADFTNPGTPMPGAVTGAIPAENRVVALQSVAETDYMFNEDDMLGHCYIWIDIPAMRIDPTVAQKGANIDVAVRLLFNREVGICEDCAPPDICWCRRTVGKVCCDTGTTQDPDKGCVFFPYAVVQNAAGWETGIALTATVPLPDNAYYELTLTDAAGNVATYRKSADVSRIWAFMLDSELANFAMTQGTALVPGAVSVNATSNFAMDGYSFLTDGNFGAGTLARGCAGNCCP